MDAARAEREWHLDWDFTGFLLGAGRELGGRQLKQKKGPLHAALHQVKKRQQEIAKVQSGFGNSGSPYGRRSKHSEYV